MPEEFATQRELTPADYMAMVRRHWVLILVLSIIGPVLAYGVSRFLPNRFKSQTLVLVEPPNLDPGILPTEMVDISKDLASMKQQILSRSRLEPVINQFGLFPDDVKKKSMDEVVGKLQQAIEVTAIQPMAETQSRDLPGFFVDVTLDDAHTAQGVCTAITSMFIEESNEMQAQRNQHTTQFLSQQLAEAKADLDAQDAKLATFKGHYFDSLPDNQQPNMNLLDNATSRLNAATQAVAQAQQDKSFQESMLTQQIAAWQASQGGHNPETLEQQLVALQTQLTSLQARYTDDYPDVIKTKADIAALEKKIADSTAAKAASESSSQKPIVEPAPITQLRAQIHSYDQIIAEKTREQEQIKEQMKTYQSRLQMSPVVEEQYKELTRGYQTALDAYNDLLKKQNTAEMTEDLSKQSQTEQFRVLDPANLPDSPSFPNRRLFALCGLGGGLGLGLAITFILEMQDKSFKTERDVEFALRLPVLAMVPAIEPVATKKSGRKGFRGPADSGVGMRLGA